MSNPSKKWSSFRKRICIDQPLKKVYEAWSTPEQIESWFLEKASYTDNQGHKRPAEKPVNEGDSFEWKWHNWDFTETGKILEANGTDRISFTFGTGGIVHIDLREEPSGTMVTLTQEEIPTDEESKLNIFVGCSTGWTFWMANLKAWLEHGITLHATGLRQDETTDLVNS
jgi:uncharacterized protein YndB with AHSA1/START domain